MKLIKKLCQKLMGLEFIKYFIVGGLATIVDWSIFYILAIKLNLYYQFGVITGVFVGGITNYSLNKIFTFKCKSKKIAKQFTIFSIIVIFSILLSMGIIFILIELFGLEKLIARVLTTAILLFINYFMHKHLTFNKKIFKQEMPDLF